MLLFYRIPIILTLFMLSQATSLQKLDLFKTQNVTTEIFKRDTHKIHSRPKRVVYQGLYKELCMFLEKKGDSLSSKALCAGIFIAEKWIITTRTPLVYKKVGEFVAVSDSLLRPDKLRPYEIVDFFARGQDGNYH